MPASPFTDSAVYYCMALTRYCRAVFGVPPEVKEFSAPPGGSDSIQSSTHILWVPVATGSAAGLDLFGGGPHFCEDDAVTHPMRDLRVPCETRDVVGPSSRVRVMSHKQQQNNADYARDCIRRNVLAPDGPGYCQVELRYLPKHWDVMNLLARYATVPSFDTPSGGVKLDRVFLTAPGTLASDRTLFIREWWPKEVLGNFCEGTLGPLRDSDRVTLQVQSPAKLWCTVHVLPPHHLNRHHTTA